jgi:hypothetical protein
MEHLGQKIFSIIPTDFVHFRIVDLNTTNTLSEYSAGRNGKTFPDLKISNAKLIETGVIEGAYVCQVNPRNLTIKVFCLISPQSPDEEQMVMIEAIMNQLKMLFLVFSSHYYQNSHLIK